MEENSPLLDAVNKKLDELTASFTKQLDEELPSVSEYAAKDTNLSGPDELSVVEDWVGYIDDVVNTADDMFTATKSPLYSAYKRVNDRRREFLGWIEDTRDNLRTKARRYMLDTGDESDMFLLREHYVAKVDDFEALVKAVAAGDAPLELLTVDEKFANQAASTLKETMQYPGLRAENEPTLAKRPAKGSKE